MNRENSPNLVKELEVNPPSTDVEVDGGVGSESFWALTTIPLEIVVCVAVWLVLLFLLGAGLK